MTVPGAACMSVSTSEDELTPCVYIKQAYKSSNLRKRRKSKTRLNLRCSAAGYTNSVWAYGVQTHWVELKGKYKMEETEHRSEILKIKIFGVDTNTGWFLHQTRCGQSLKNIVGEIFSGINPCITKAKVVELTGHDIAGAEIYKYLQLYNIDLIFFTCHFYC